MGEGDLAIDLEFLQDAGNGERRANGEHLPSVQCTARQCALDRRLDLPLSGDAEALEEFAKLEVENVSVHKSPPCLSRAGVSPGGRSGPAVRHAMLTYL